MSTKIRQDVSSRAFLSAAVVAAVAGFGSTAMAGGGAGFSYPNFSTTAGLALNGHASQTGNTIDLNGSFALGARAGSVWHQNQQPVSMGFVSNFSFRILDSQGAGGGGFAFTIHNSNSGPGGTASFGTSALGAAGGALGYGSNVLAGGTNLGINNSLTVEFDTFYNPVANNDYAGDHIALHNWGTAGEMPVLANSIAGVIAPASGSWSNVSDGRIYDVRIQYAPGVFEVLIKRATDGAFGAPVLSQSLDLSTIVPLNPNGDGVGQAWVGFTAATGGIQDFERHQILGWDFSGNTIPTPGAASLLALGGLTLTRRRRR